MRSARQRQWRSQIQQRALLEYGLLKHACPECMYLSLTPGNFALWSGVLFVRKGPYASAVLRFQLAFPQRYPEVPPLVLFTSDVFHPLVTPLTTYTYTTGGSSTDTVSATDEERLLPGGFSLRQGFPRWFERGDRMSPAAPMFQDIKMPRDKGFGDSSGSGEYSQPEGSDDGARRIKAIHIPPPKDDGLSDDDISPSIIEVLEYVKRVFEVESLLDDLPLDSAGNPGAWHAWRAYRRKSRRAKSPDGVEKRPSTSQRGPDSGGRSKPQNDWNWDGVWVERVKRGINVSLSEAMLFGGSDGDDLIHFLDLGDEVVESIKRDVLLKVERPNRVIE